MLYTDVIHFFELELFSINSKSECFGVPAAKRGNYTLRIKTNQNNYLSIL